jgi:YVTN family beta-propeller protein
VTATVPVGSAPVLVAITPDGAFAYVTNSGSNSVSVINIATNTVTATIPVGIFPQGIAILVKGAGPTSKDQCKKYGWRNFTNPTFRNQGQCVSYVNHL